MAGMKLMHSQKSARLHLRRSAQSGQLAAEVIVWRLVVFTLGSEAREAPS
jgi:hypothetical protein